MNPTAPAFSAAARAAGTILAAGYVAGLVPGSVIAIVGALALVTFGRSLLAPRAESTLDAAALAVVAASLLAGAVRWRTLDVTEIRGAQTVLGPTVLLGPTIAAGAAWTAAGAGILALAEWEAFPGAKNRVDVFWWVTETLLGALALVSIFWGPEIAGADEGSSLVEGLATWVAATVVVGAIALGLSYVSRRSGMGVRAGLLVIAAAALAVAIALIGEVG